MAESESIASLLRVEEIAHDLELLCRVVHDASEPSPPEWLALVYPRVHDLVQAVRVHGSEARRHEC